MEEKLDTLDFYNAVCLDKIFLKGKAYHYMFLKHLKESGCTIKNVILFTKHFGPASGYTHSEWKEALHSDTLTNRRKQQAKRATCEHSEPNRARGSPPKKIFRL